MAKSMEKDEQVLPRELNEISDPVIADLIVTCLLPLDQRPTAAQLAANELFADVNRGDLSPRKAEPELEAQEPLALDFPVRAEMRQRREFLDLIHKQNLETQELLKKQKEDRTKLTQRLRSDGNSLRKLLNDYKD